MTATELMQAIETQLPHVWMVRTFLKHSDEADDEDVQEVYRSLYDFSQSLGPALQAQDAEAYVKQALRKFGTLRRACELFCEAQPDVSGHMNFQMAAASLRTSVGEIERLLAIADGKNDT